MGAKRDTFGRAFAAAACATLVVVVLAGVVGAVWRLALWQTMHGPHSAAAMGGENFAGPGFELGFGVPLSTVFVWAVLVGIAVAVGFLVAERFGRRRVTDSAVRRDGR